MKKRDQGTILLWAAIAVGAPRWAGAMLAADVGMIEGWATDFLHVANTISGLAMGPLEVLAMAYMLDSLRRQKPTNKTKSGESINFRWWGVLLFSVGLLVLTPVILAPYIVARMNVAGMATVMPSTVAQFAWSIAVTLAPAFLVGGVAFAQAGLVRMSGETGEQTGENSPKKGEQKANMRKTNLAPQDWDFIRRSSTNQIASRYGVSLRVAQIWKRDANQADRTALRGKTNGDSRTSGAGEGHR